ncbi:hypothetical protein ACF0H5_016734 [Mactra antiquata]
MMSKRYLAVVAIGIKHSSYCSSVVSFFDQDPLKIQGRTWQSFNRFMKAETISSILFQPDCKFHSFGFEAEEKYEELKVDNEHKKWYFIKNPTKMLFDSKDVHRSATILDETNKPMLAIDVFASAIKYLKDDTMNANGIRMLISMEDIRWVLPLPDIWDESAKQFIREAAIQSGISDDNLALCLETEAASTLFKYLPNEHLYKSSDMEISTFQPGLKYLILNAGGEFFNVAVLEVLYSGKLRELHKVSGGPWGCVTVNQEFIDFMKSLIGAEVLIEFREKEQGEYMRMVEDFERRILSWKPERNSNTNFRIPRELNILYKKINYRDTIVISPKMSEKVSFRVNASILKVDNEIVETFFSKTCDTIVKHIIGIFSESRAKDFSTILMVGKLSKSTVLQKAIKQAFPDKAVVVSDSPDSDVLRGAAIFGHDSCSTITPSIVKNTCRGYRKF